MAEPIPLAHSFLGSCPRSRIGPCKHHFIKTCVMGRIAMRQGSSHTGLTAVGVWLFEKTSIQIEMNAPHSLTWERKNP